MNTTTTAAGPTLPYAIGNIDLQRISSGSDFVNVSVHGFWSRDPIYISFRRELADWRDEGSAFWRAAVRHSAGGRDDKVCDDLTAEENFGAALIAAVQTARHLEAQSPFFEQVYRQAAAERAAERSALAAAHEARVAADPALGAVAAKAIMRAAIQTSCGSAYGTDVLINVIGRGMDAAGNHGHIVVKNSGYKRSLPRLNGVAVSIAAATEALAAASHRSGIVTTATITE